MGRLVVGDVVYRRRSLVGDVPMADPPILIDFGDNNPDEAPDREHRLVPEPPPVIRRRDIEDVETKEDLL